MKVERGFKGVWIPADVWVNDELTWMEKLFFVEIDSLDKEHGCFASNDHFSRMFDLSKNRCTEIIKSLEKKQFVTIELEREGKRISKRIVRVNPIRKTEHPYSENRDTPIRKTEHPYSENREDNNTIINNTKERDSALAFLESNSPSQLETFMMHNKKQIGDWEKFVLDFEAVVTLEEIPFETNKLFARMGQYARNWIKNNHNGRFQVIKNENETNRMANRHLNAAI